MAEPSNHHFCRQHVEEPRIAPDAANQAFSIACWSEMNGSWVDPTGL